MAHPVGTIYSPLRNSVNAIEKAIFKSAMTHTKLIFFFFIAALQSACSVKKEDVSLQQPSDLAAIGEAMFNDARLSADQRTRCSSCHIPEHAFTDARPVSIGVFGRTGTRNSPSLIGVNEDSPQFWDGRENNLTAAVLQPWANPMEMGHDSMAHAIQRIATQPEYATFFGGSITEKDIAAALTSYLKSITSDQSLFERARAANDYRMLGAQAQRGMQLFQGKAQCSSCHPIDGRGELSDGKFHHASVGFERIAGNIRALQERVRQARVAGEPIGTMILTDSEIAELGRFVVSQTPEDLGAFRTPSLLNVARTAPYMHDGSIQTLEAAIEHELYYRGLTSGQPISLTVDERKELLAFLETLSTP